MASTGPALLAVGAWAGVNSQMHQSWMSAMSPAGGRGGNSGTTGKKNNLTRKICQIDVAVDRCGGLLSCAHTVPPTGMNGRAGLLCCWPGG